MSSVEKIPRNQPGHNASPTPEDLIRFANAQHSSAAQLLPEDHELYTKLPINDPDLNDAPVVPIEEIENIEPEETPGHFRVNLKHDLRVKLKDGVVANKGKIFVISGAGLLALATYTFARKKRDKE